MTGDLRGLVKCLSRNPCSISLASSSRDTVDYKLDQKLAPKKNFHGVIFNRRNFGTTHHRRPAVLMKHWLRGKSIVYAVKPWLAKRGRRIANQA